MIEDGSLRKTHTSVIFLVVSGHSNGRNIDQFCYMNHVLSYYNVDH